MVTHSSILAWRIPWREESGGYSRRGCKESDTTEQLGHIHIWKINLVKSGLLSPPTRRPSILRNDTWMHSGWIRSQVEKQEHGHTSDGLKTGLTCGLLCCGVHRAFVTPALLLGVVVGVWGEHWKSLIFFNKKKLLRSFSHLCLLFVCVCVCVCVCVFLFVFFVCVSSLAAFSYFGVHSVHIT